MRYFIIINPPEYRDNDEDEGGYAWAGEAENEEDAKLQAIAECEVTNGWTEEDERIDPEDTDVIEFGPDYQFMVEEARKVLAKAPDGCAEVVKACALADLRALLA